MDSRATGIILRTRPLTETSLIVHWLTSDFGRIATVAKGARRPKSPFRGKLDLFHLCEFTFARSRRSDLHTLREVSLRRAHGPLRQDLGKVQQASYCAALIEQTTEIETALPGESDLLGELLTALAGVPVNPASVLAFELKLLAQHGQSPDPNSLSISEGARRVVERLTQGSWEEIARLRPSRTQIVEISRFLHDFMIYHVGRVPRGRGAALDLETA